MVNNIIVNVQKYCWYYIKNIDKLQYLCYNLDKGGPVKLKNLTGTPLLHTQKGCYYEHYYRWTQM